MAPVELVTTFERLLALRSEWLALEEASGTLLPFQTWEWSVAWWTHFREDRASVRDHLRVCVVRGTDDRVLGIAPFLLTERPAAGPLRLRYLQLMGADNNVTEVRAMLCRRGSELQCYAALREFFKTQSNDWDWIVWNGLDHHPSGADEMPGRDLIGVEKTFAFMLPLPPTWSELKKGLRRNIKESLRKCYNSLERDGLTVQLETVDCPRAVDRALADFARLHTERARMRNTPVHPDVFEWPPARAFLGEVCQLFAQRGVTRIFRLWAGNRVVATRIGFELGQSLYLYYSGWEPAFGKYSIMTRLLCEVIKYAIDRGMTSVHLSFGRDVAKTRWSPIEVAYLHGVELSARPAARALYLSYAWMNRPPSRDIVRRHMPRVLFRRPS